MRTRAQRDGSNPGLDVSRAFRTEWWHDFQRRHPAGAARLHALDAARYPLDAPPVAAVIAITRPSRRRRRLLDDLDAAVRSDTLRRAGLALVLVLALITPAWAQTPATCDTVLGCQQERVRDFKDYVDYLEAERAWCKTINKSLNTTINALRAEVEALKKAAAPKAPELPQP